MGNVSTEWLAAISTGRDYSIDEKKKGCAVPVTPWLHPPVGKRLRDLITKLGTVRELERQEILYPQGRKVSDIYGKDRKGKEITIKLACYREVDGELMRYRRKMEKTSYIDFTSYKALPMDPVNCFEKEQTDYTKADAILKAMHLNEMEFAVLDCVLKGLVRSEIIAELGIGRGSICYRKRQIRSKYQTYFDFLK